MEVSFLRKWRGGTFKYPQASDLGWLTVGDPVEKLRDPLMKRRGLLYFAELEHRTDIE